MVRVVVFQWLLALAFNASGQGCSDAGFCTMGAMKPDQPFNKKVEFKLRSMEFSFYRGTTTTSPIVYVATADLNFSITPKTFFQVKLPYQAVKGNFGKTNGMGDISLSLTQNIKSTDKYDVNATIGAKIPSNKANLSDPTRNNIVFPMYYQTSLGTYDFITGISLKTRDWLFATGLQHPFNKNENTFVWEEWREPVYPDFNYVKTYNQSNRLKRGTDIMFRAERNFRFSQFNVSLGALPIIRVSKDSILDPVTGTRKKLEGTTGMALSVIGTFGYGFNVQSGVRLLMGVKLTDRKVNPDGLTRDMVTTVSYYYRF
ncbi:MAG: hypothetical protein M9954_15995 [Cyclobacteriaceae bacterium]|nr:hypothetical protein [Cyclobacteriaceae bacterium]MCB9236578.1 hypothetical protein [Flammeovirgaceae bacterium]MCO5273162.1 hypothetical protein [Cyclobacteriaceae bacterium]MCW5903243.1 hypothetical protein [Cyclobacteriaceae bacterium]